MSWFDLPTGDVSRETFLLHAVTSSEVKLWHLCYPTPNRKAGAEKEWGESSQLRIRKEGWGRRPRQSTLPPVSRLQRRRSFWLTRIHREAPPEELVFPPRTTPAASTTS